MAVELSLLNNFVCKHLMVPIHSSCDFDTCTGGRPESLGMIRSFVVRSVTISEFQILSRFNSSEMLSGGPTVWVGAYHVYFENGGYFSASQTVN